MTLELALDFLNSRIPVGWKLGLDSMNKMLSELGDPHQKLKFVHIAGTNGKGSVASMLASIFRNAGYKTGLYTSPHLVDVRERIQYNGEKIEADDFSRLINVVKPVIEKFNATYFETLTVLAFRFFVEKEADLVVLETGLGGRLDATNVVDPELSIITSIDFDHTDHLGATLAEIAGEKAGIIKNNRPCLVGHLPEEALSRIIAKAEQQQAPIYNATDFYQFNVIDETPGQTTFSTIDKKKMSEHFTLALNGQFQVANACIAISACDILKSRGLNIKREHIKSGLRQVVWPGRFQLIRHNPPIILDVAHNVAAVQQLVQQLRRFYGDKKILVCMGVLKDKDYGEMTKEIASIATTVQPVEVQSDRALAARELQNEFQRFNINVLPAKSLSHALHDLISLVDAEAVLCITGSHYVVGEALVLIKDLTK